MILSGHVGRAVRFLEQGIEIAGARGDVESAFRMEAQLSAIQQRPLPVWRARLSGYVDQIPPDSVSGRLAARAHRRVERVRRHRGRGRRGGAPRAQPRRAHLRRAARAVRARPRDAGLGLRRRARRGAARRRAGAGLRAAAQRDARARLRLVAQQLRRLGLRRPRRGRGRHPPVARGRPPRPDALRRAAAAWRCSPACSSRAGSATPPRRSSWRAA